VAGAAAIPLLLSGCLTGSTDDDGSGGETAPRAGGDDEPVTIEFWSMPFWIGDDQKVGELVDEFNASQDDIVVEFTHLEWQDGRESLKQAVAAGTGPDVFIMDNGLDLDYLESSSLATLTELGYTQDDIDMFLPLIEVNEYEGQLYGAPLYFGTTVLVYRPDVLAEYGFDSPPATWEALKETAATITRESDEEIWGWQFKGMDDHLNAIHSQWQTYLWQAGGRYMNEDMTRSAEASQAAEETLAWMRSFYDEGVSPVGTSAEGGFVGGNVAMFSFFATVQVGDVDGEWAFAPMPVGPDNGASYFGGHSVVATANGNLEAAGEFMRWMSSPELGRRYMEFNAIFPYDLDAAPEEIGAEVQELIDTDENWAAIFEQIGRNDPLVLQQDRVAKSARWSAQAAQVVAAVNGDRDPADALEALDAEINEAIDAG
jgi:ABC-type glycerol-3-phosphate transport system substrate-binding protein